MPKTAQNPNIETQQENPTEVTKDSADEMELKIIPRADTVVKKNDEALEFSISNAKILAAPTFKIPDGAIQFDSATGPVAANTICIKLLEFKSKEKANFHETVLGVSAEAIGFYLELTPDEKVFLNENGLAKVDRVKSPSPMVVARYSVQWGVPPAGSSSGRAGQVALNLVPKNNIKRKSVPTGRIGKDGVREMSRPYEDLEATSQLRDAIESVIFTLAESDNEEHKAIFNAIPTSIAAQEAEGGDSPAKHMKNLAKGESGVFAPMSSTVTNDEVED